MKISPALLFGMTNCTLANAALFAGPIERAMDEFGIDTAIRAAHFVAQIAHESARLSRLEENLFYSWPRLMKVWPRRFPSEAFARQFHRQPERIANYVYGGRMGNGSPASGDGWRYRGRGLKQLTGKNNYARCSAAMGVDLVQQPGLLLEPDFAARSAAWHWSAVGANEAADADDIKRVTMLINGGRNGLAERVESLDRADDWIDELSARTAAVECAKFALGTSWHYTGALA